MPFYLLDVPLDLIADCKALIADIRKQVVGRPTVIVVDTLNRAIAGDENSSEDMAKFIKAADMLRVAFNNLVIVIHHCGVVGTRPRGHTSLSGADDAQIAVERDKDEAVIARVTATPSRPASQSEPKAKPAASNSPKSNASPSTCSRS